MDEIIEVADEAKNVSAKALTALVGASILSLGILDIIIFAPDDAALPFPVNWTDEIVLVGTGLLLIHQSEMIGEIQKHVP